MASLELRFDLVEQNLKRALTFVGDLDRAYREATQKLRRQMNQALFTRILVSDDGEVVGELRPPFELLFRATGTSEDGFVRGGADQGKIPLQLADMMNVSRTLGNLGAHHTGFGFTDDDVKTVIDFARTLFEYLYVAPAKVEAFRRSVAERKS